MQSVPHLEPILRKVFGTDIPGQPYLHKVQGPGLTITGVEATCEEADAGSDSVPTAFTPSDTPSDMPWQMRLEVPSNMPSDMPSDMPSEMPSEVLFGQRSVSLTYRTQEAWLRKHAQPDLPQSLQTHSLQQQPAFGGAYADGEADNVVLHDSEGPGTAASREVCQSQVSVPTWADVAVACKSTMLDLHYLPAFSPRYFRCE